MKRHPISESAKMWITAFIILFIFISILSVELAGFDTSANKELPVAHQTMAFYNAQMFIDRGNILTALPDGVVFLGKTNYNRNIYSFKNNLECNEKGILYLDPKNTSVLYFQFSSWDEMADGPMKYIILELIDE